MVEPTYSSMLEEKSFNISVVKSDTVTNSDFVFPDSDGLRKKFIYKTKQKENTNTNKSFH